jgi:hypothetical protein
MNLLSPPKATRAAGRDPQNGALVAEEALIQINARVPVAARYQFAREPAER